MTDDKALFPGSFEIGFHRNIWDAGTSTPNIPSRLMSTIWGEFKD